MIFTTMKQTFEVYTWPPLPYISLTMPRFAIYKFVSKLFFKALGKYVAFAHNDLKLKADEYGICNDLDIKYVPGINIQT